MCPTFALIGITWPPNVTNSRPRGPRRSLDHIGNVYLLTRTLTHNHALHAGHVAFLGRDLKVSVDDPVKDC